MCGGRGERLKAGEKPLFVVCGMKLIDHSLLELKGFKILAVTSPFTPKTEEYLKAIGIEFYRASGKGFIEDYVETCKSLNISEKVLIVCSDLVYFRRGILREVADFYKKSKRSALKVLKAGSKEPVGINVVDASKICEEQEEVEFVIEDGDVINVNTLEDVKRAEELWRSRERGL